MLAVWPTIAEGFQPHVLERFGIIILERLLYMGFPIANIHVAVACARSVLKYFPAQEYHEEKQHRPKQISLSRKLKRNQLYYNFFACYPGHGHLFKASSFG